MSGSVQLVLQAAVGDGLSFDPFSFCQNDVAAAEIGIGRSQIANALVVTAVIVVVDETVSVSRWASCAELCD